MKKCRPSTTIVTIQDTHSKRKIHQLSINIPITQATFQMKIKPKPNTSIHTTQATPSKKKSQMVFMIWMAQLMSKPAVQSQQK